jgi:hypothetical protein
MHTIKATHETIHKMVKLNMDNKTYNRAVITPESQEIIWVLCDSELSLSGDQADVGGYVEHVPYQYNDRHSASMLVNENGRMHSLPNNPIASAMAKKPICGTVVAYDMSLCDIEKLFDEA